MTVPADPGDFLNPPPGAPVGAPYLLDADAVDARFLQLYRYLDKTIVGVDADAILDGIVTRALVEAQPAWSTLALAGTTWTPANLSYFKDSRGIVHIRPEQFTGTANLTAGTTIATFPVGTRPATKLWIPGTRVVSGGQFGSAGFSIDTNGVFKLEQAGAAPTTQCPLTNPLQIAGEWRAEQ